ncbi:PLD nuclease N-terminal domain-containing protein [Corynebacterium halotolerans]|uniref:PLD nuclease N-terminal domain-containing protein n=1 Tax=Corynebacterium halotolerans TaxID=225326 RepID=UPI003CF01259
MEINFIPSRESIEQQRRELREKIGPKGEVVLAAAVALEVAGKVATWISLARRGRDEVRGPKWLWRLATGVNFFGPAAYWLFGRKKPRR